MGGVRHGKGSYYWVSGESFVGEWRKDMMNGVGVFNFKDGGKMEAEFQDNIRVLG